MPSCSDPAPCDDDEQLFERSGWRQVTWAVAVGGGVYVGQECRPRVPRPEYHQSALLLGSSTRPRRPRGRRRPRLGDRLRSRAVSTRRPHEDSVRAAVTTGTSRRGKHCRERSEVLLAVDVQKCRLVAVETVSSAASRSAVSVAAGSSTESVRSKPSIAAATSASTAERSVRSSTSARSGVRPASMRWYVTMSPTAMMGSPASASSAAVSVEIRPSGSFSRAASHSAVEHSGPSADLQRVAAGFGDVHLGGDFAVFGMGDDDVARPVLGESGAAAVLAGFRSALWTQWHSRQASRSAISYPPPSLARWRFDSSQPCLPSPGCLAVRPIFESRGLRSSMLLVTMRARTASSTVSVWLDSREARRSPRRARYSSNLGDAQQAIDRPDADEGPEVDDLDDLAVDHLLHLWVEREGVELGLVVDAGRFGSTAPVPMSWTSMTVTTLPTSSSIRPSNFSCKSRLTSPGLTSARKRAGSYADSDSALPVYTCVMVE